MRCARRARWESCRGGGCSRRAGAGAATLALSRRAAAQDTGRILKIGSMGPFTGPASRTGAEIKNGVMLALEDAKAAGEIPGRRRRQEARRRGGVGRRASTSPETGIKAYTDAITRQGIQFAMNGWHSSVAMAVSELTSTYKIVHVGDLGETQFLAEKMAKDPAQV